MPSDTTAWRPVEDDHTPMRGIDVEQKEMFAMPHEVGEIVQQGIADGAFRVAIEFTVIPRFPLCITPSEAGFLKGFTITFQRRAK